MAIHPTAIVDAKAEIDPAAEIGPYAIIEGGVRIGAGTRVFGHAYIGTGTTIGQRCHIHPFAVVGNAPQDVKYTGAPTYAVIGDDTILREHTSVHRGTTPESTTTVGNRCFLMATAHVGHNCTVGDGVVMVNGSMLGGHVSIEARALIFGDAAVHQFARVGELAAIAGMAAVRMDVPPFMLMDLGGVAGVNLIGLKRAGFSPAERNEIRECFKILYRSPLLFRDAMARVIEMVKTEPGRRLAQFLQAPSKRGYVGSVYRRGDRSAAAAEAAGDA